ncbi:uncharacterized protein PITG_20398 [Phytophthora infestans T30-4]|uniref:Uncharacterized protein n=1 Tax=Phytophthora infestans (strain T30-4) TaxID=403677 RepID=D0P1T5_PHYIT|nr:uncharacterized protein PITG_20398 [Phytophthora infestans T30-4]EEY54723.1 conserved hypothetical protein [Phytophthora infestans T30-4]|eukprot:XP_002895759.1 conserved hypothetical protein [Phytophthora infestans T30-4]
MADDENNADLANADSATGLAACLASEEDELREVARAPHPRGVRAVKSNASGIVLHVHERNSDSDYEPEEDGNSEDKDGDVADDLEVEWTAWTAIPIRYPSASGLEIMIKKLQMYFPTQDLFEIEQERTPVVKGHLWQNWFPLTAFHVGDAAKRVTSESALLDLSSITAEVNA